MKLLCTFICLIIPCLATDSPEATLSTLVSLERKAMDGWLKGDPDPQLSLLDPRIVFIHDTVGKRLDGIAAVKALYANYRGTPLFESYEIVSPKVVASGAVAILTYQLAQHAGSATRYWNGTIVYEKQPDGWRVIHTHWSAAKERQS